jgi:hypothetical protein
MQVKHPRAGDGPGTPPAAVDVNGDRRPVNEDGVFEGGDDSWLARFAARHNVDPDTLRVDDTDDAVAETLPFEPGELTVGDLEARLADVDDAGTLRALRDQEASDKDRTTAIDAIDARLDNLED